MQNKQININDRKSDAGEDNRGAGRNNCTVIRGGAVIRGAPPVVRPSVSVCAANGVGRLAVASSSQRRFSSGHYGERRSASPIKSARTDAPVVLVPSR